VRLRSAAALRICEAHRLTRLSLPNRVGLSLNKHRILKTHNGRCRLISTFHLMITQQKTITGNLEALCRVPIGFGRHGRIDRGRQLWARAHRTFLRLPHLQLISDPNLVRKVTAHNPALVAQQQNYHLQRRPDSSSLKSQYLITDLVFRRYVASSAE